VTYRVQIQPPARKQLEKLDHQVRERVGRAIDALADNPRPQGCKHLVGRPAYRIRVGDWRVIYEVHDGLLLVLVLELGHRREIYDR
jgi:mRNA interferase RelE/StbE